MTSSNVDLRGVPELVRDIWKNHSYEENSTIASVIHLATYDLDYYSYLLVQTWDYIESQFGDTEVRWEYSLWYGSSTNPVKLRDFPNTKEGAIPFVASAQAVEDHIKYIDEYTEEHHEFPEIE